jgi:hypothetical protein
MRRVPETGSRGNRGASARSSATRPQERPAAPGPFRGRVTVEDGNLDEGWIHIDARHVTGNHPQGAGDLFAPGTTRAQIQTAANELVQSGTRISPRNARIQVFERRMTINGLSARYRVVVDTVREVVITIFPALGGG